MSKFDVKLIALDLDDTLLNDDRQITDVTVDALRECARRGIYVVLCSGRAEDAILPFVRRLEIAGLEAGRFLIAINGCSIFDLHKRQQIFCRKVEADILIRTNEVAEARGLRSEVYTPDTIYYREETKWTKLDVDLCGLKGAAVDDYDEFLKTGFTKMLVPGETSDLLDLQKKFNDLSSKFTTTINRFTRNSKSKPSLFSQINELKNFGIISAKEIPTEFLEESTDEAIEIMSGIGSNKG